MVEDIYVEIHKGFDFQMFALEWCNDITDIFESISATMMIVFSKFEMERIAE